MSNTDWHREETFKSLVTIGNNSLKFVLLINGGAIIALLTFLGNLLKTQPVSISTVFSFAMTLYILGIVCAGFAHLTSYMTQLKLYNEKNGSEKHTKWLYGTMGLLVSGIILFVIGSVCVLKGLQSIH